ncbi:hypothetical protein [Nocardiopsis lucentensis]|uniref:hypothetical protein n=1 Tax=Nocardiopsis lucentensis TaxID=53441 RepID=UPI000344E4CE|nr:hypothetical protein [Nocardiopsis lucentensis]
MPGIPCLPSQMVDAPKDPPHLYLGGVREGFALARVAVDWAALGGPFEEPGDTVTWPRFPSAPGPIAEFVFDTAQIPMRVVVYSYPDVGPDGIPDEEHGTETLCSFGEPSSGPCWYRGGDGENVRVAVRDVRAGDHLVVHAAWPVLSGDRVQGELNEVSGSWLCGIGGYRAVRPEHG